MESRKKAKVPKNTMKARKKVKTGTSSRRRLRVTIKSDVVTAATAAAKTRMKSQKRRKADLTSCRRGVVSYL